MYLLGIDLGTTGCKSILFTQSCGIISEYYIEYPLITTPEGFIEQDAGLWWELSKEVIKETVKKSGINSKEIHAMSVSSQGIAFVPVDKDGNALCNAISWLDTRAESQTGFIREKFGERSVFERTAKRLHPSYSLPKMMWLKQNKSEIYKKAWKLLMGMDYLTYKLTGVAVTDHSMAGGTMAYNISQKNWDIELLKQCGIDVGKLPEIQYSGHHVGKVLPEVAAETGLSAETVVILGAQDQKCAAVGAGIHKGICTLSLGTATAITAVFDRPVFDEEMRIPCYPLDEDKWVLESVIGTSGASLKWMRNTFFKDKSYSEIDEIISHVPAASGDTFFYPHMEGAASPFWEPDARGFIYGLSLSTSEGQIMRSLYEGIAYQIRVNLDVLEQLGSTIEEIRIFGGGAKSDIWCKIIADVTGKKVSTLYTSEAANLGAALKAGKGSGIYMKNDSASVQIKLVDKTFQPEESIREIYEKAYCRYGKIQEAVVRELLNKNG